MYYVLYYQSFHHQKHLSHWSMADKIQTGFDEMFMATNYVNYEPYFAKSMVVSMNVQYYALVLVILLN